MPLSKAQCYSLFSDMIDSTNKALSKYTVGEYIKSSYDDTTNVYQIECITYGQYSRGLFGTVSLDIVPSFILLPIAVGVFSPSGYQYKMIWRSKKGCPAFEAIKVFEPHKYRSGMTMGQWSTPSVTPFCRYQDIRGVSEKVRQEDPYSKVDNTMMVAVLKAAKMQKEEDRIEALRASKLEEKRRQENERVTQSEIKDLWDSL